MKKIIIIGASTGIGQLLFEDFHVNNYDVIGTYNNHIIENNSRYLKLDILDSLAVERFASQYAQDQVVLVCCAGVTYNSFAHKADLEKWKKVINVNINGVFNVIHSFLPHMRNVGWGRIILFSSVVTKLPTMGVSAYAASKAALNGLTKSIAVENASKGITVNSINLGYTNAGMGLNDIPETIKETLMERIPLHRFCEHNEIFNTIEYLINTPYATGGSIDLNGGIA